MQEGMGKIVNRTREHLGPTDTAQMQFRKRLLEAARDFVTGNVLDAPFSGDVEAGTDIQPAITNFKFALQELAQQRNLPQPRYSMVQEKGPEHLKTFTVEVRVGKDWNGQAEGRTKKIAAQRAARALYERLRTDADGEPTTEGAGSLS